MKQKYIEENQAFMPTSLVQCADFSHSVHLFLAKRTVQKRTELFKKRTKPNHATGVV